MVTLDDGFKSNFKSLEVFRQCGVVPTIFIASGVVDTKVPGGRSDVERLKTVPDSERVKALASFGHGETDTFPDRSALSRAEIELMMRNVDFQSHTVLHPILSMCSDDRSRTEIAESKTALEQRYGLDVFALAYPNGTAADFGKREPSLATVAGYRCAVTTIPGLNDGRTDLFRLRRIVIPDEAAESEVVVRASLVPEYLKRAPPFLRRWPHT